MVKSVTLEEVKPVLLRALKSSQGYKFDRERAFEEYQGGAEVFEAIQYDINGCVSGTSLKRCRSVVSVVAGRGDGKSRLLDEMKTIMRGNESFKKQTCYTLYCNFENGAPVVPFPTCERTTELWARQRLVEKEMLDRIMFVLMSTITDGPCPVGYSSFPIYQHEHDWDFSLRALVKAIETVSPDAFVMICVDGAHAMDPLLEPAHFTDEREIESEKKNNHKYREIYDRSCLKIVFHLLSETLVRCPGCPRVFAVLTSATDMICPFGDYYALYLEVTPPSITKMPQEVQNSVET